MQNVFYEADYIYANKDNAQVVCIEYGLKVRVNKEGLELLQSSKEIADKYKLNIKRLNRWYYSVYFDRRD